MFKTGFWLNRRSRASLAPVCALPPKPLLTSSWHALDQPDSPAACTSRFLPPGETKIRDGRKLRADPNPPRQGSGHPPNRLNSKPATPKPLSRTKADLARTRKSFRGLIAALASICALYTMIKEVRKSRKRYLDWYFA